MSKITVELDLDNEVDLMKLQMMLHAESIYFAIRAFDSDDTLDQVSRDLLFEKFDDQKEGLINIFYP